MKKLMIPIVTLFLGTTVIAKSDSMPAYLKDAVITVTLKNGQVYTFSSNEYAVVPRSQMSKNNAVEPASERLEVVERASKAEKSKNRLRLMGGLGPNGLKTETRENTVKVSPKRAPVFGLGYDRMVSDDVSVNGQILTNGTTLIGVGVDW